MTEYEKIFSTLNRHKVKYLVVGGVAVNLYGYMRFTADIDIIILLEERNLSKMEEAMKELEYGPRLPVQLKALNDKKQVEQWMKRKNLKAYTFNPPKGAMMQIDIIIEESLNFENIARQSTFKKAGEIRIPLVGLEDLIKMKKKANRPKDNLDLSTLQELKKL